MAGRVLARLYESPNGVRELRPRLCPASKGQGLPPACAHLERNGMPSYCAFLYGYECVDRGNRARFAPDSLVDNGLSVNLLPGQYIEALCLRCDSRDTEPGS